MIYYYNIVIVVGNVAWIEEVNWNNEPLSVREFMEHDDTVKIQSKRNTIYANISGELIHDDTRTRLCITAVEVYSDSH